MSESNKSKDPILLISSKDKKETDSYDKHKSVEVYVEQTNIPNPYNLADLVNITATDYSGIVNLNSRLNVNWDNVDFTKAGTYTVTVSVMDDSLNLALNSFIIHVVPSETKKIKTKVTTENKKVKKSIRKDKIKNINNVFDELKLSTIFSWGFTLFVIIMIIIFFADMFI